MATRQNEIIKACELAFQAGGPKVYFVDAGSETPRPSCFSLRRSIEMRDEGQAVWARTKNTKRQYAWHCKAGGPLLATAETAMSNAPGALPGENETRDRQELLQLLNKTISAMPYGSVSSLMTSPRPSDDATETQNYAMLLIYLERLATELRGIAERNRQDQFKLQQYQQAAQAMRDMAALIFPKA